MTPDPRQYKFEFSLTVLNHLGRQLYRNFITIIGEAISNAWDADANNVWITLEDDRMIIRDDGHGMDSDDIQHKFLKIGYSKRKDTNSRTSPNGRPYIGAKGIGKLALLSCADRVFVISKTHDNAPDGCIFDNKKIDEAINDNRDSQDVRLTTPNPDEMMIIDNLESGTAFVFQGLRPHNATPEFLRCAIALFFRFSLIDEKFSIHFNGKEITVDDVRKLADKTQFVWKLGDGHPDPYLDRIHTDRADTITPPEGVHGFIASVNKPTDLQVFGAGTRAGVDLFVNGRLRERNIFQHHPTSRVPEQYLYGQIHYDQLDSSITNDPFTSSREEVRGGDPVFEKLLTELQPIRSLIIDQWDKWRNENSQYGDLENERFTPAQRTAEGLAREVKKSQEKRLGLGSRGKHKREYLLWDEAGKGMAANLEAYAEVYLLENYLRRLIRNYDIEIPGKLKDTAENYKKNNQSSAKKASMKPEEFRDLSDLSGFLGIADLISTVCKTLPLEKRGKHAVISDQCNKITFLRNNLMHTAKMNQKSNEQLNSSRSVIMGLVGTAALEYESRSSMDEPSS